MNPPDKKSAGQSTIPTGNHETVLIVEDEKLIGWSIVSTLAKAGFTAMLVDSGEKAIEKLYARHFDVVITDIKLPQIDGCEVASAVKALSPDSAVIMMTALADEISRAQSASPSVDYVLEKPFNLHALTTLVSQLVHARYHG